MRLFKQLVGVFAVLGVIIGALAIFAFDVVKIDWIVFMEIQPSFGTQEQPRAVPARSIPVECAMVMQDWAMALFLPFWLKRNQQTSAPNQFKAKMTAVSS